MLEGGQISRKSINKPLIRTILFLVLSISEFGVCCLWEQEPTPPRDNDRVLELNATYNDCYPHIQGMASRPPPHSLDTAKI